MNIKENIKSLPKGYTYFFLELNDIDDAIEYLNELKSRPFIVNNKAMLIIGIKTVELLTSCDVKAYPEKAVDTNNESKFYGVSLVPNSEELCFTEVNKKDLRFAFFENTYIITPDKMVKPHNRNVHLDLQNLFKVAEIIG